MGNRFYCENSLLSLSKRKETGDLYRMGERNGTVASKQALGDGGRTLRKGSCRYQHRWDAALRLTSSEETGTEVKEKDVFVFELANHDVV